MRLKIATWNMNHWQRNEVQRAETWKKVGELGLDLLMVQEAVIPDGMDSVYGGAIGSTRPWGVGIVNLNPELTLHEIRSRPLMTGEKPDAAYSDGVLEVSQPGVVVAADVSDANGTSLMTLISAYGLNADKAMNGERYTTTVVHRILSDVTPLIDTYRGKRKVIFGGDLNVSPQIGYPDTDSHRVVIDRLKAFGMIDCLGCFHDDYVQTHRASNSDKPWQDDWIFASRHLKDALVSCDAIDEDEIWALSDHCPVVLELDG